MSWCTCQAMRSRKYDASGSPSARASARASAGKGMVSYQLEAKNCCDANARSAGSVKVA
jgi:hypothetical protein